MPGLDEAVAAVRQIGGVMLHSAQAEALATVALAAARLPIMAEIYHDLADNEDLNLDGETRLQLDAIGWHLRHADEPEGTPWP